MQYMGGKQRTAKTIASYLKFIREDRPYLEPFVGAANVIIHMDGKRIGTDRHEDLILLLNAVKEGIDLPISITEEEYNLARTMPVSALRGFIGFGCSFSGKWFGGFARNGTGRNYCSNARNSLLKKQPLLQGIEFHCADYHIHEPHGMLIYCDPPYQNTTRYSNEFDHDEFWNVMRKWSEDNIVVISEYQAPSDFICVLEMPTKLDMQSVSSPRHRIERLFRRCVETC